MTTRINLSVPCLLLVFGLQSCYYSSPVSLEGEKQELPEELYGLWSMESENVSDSSERITLLIGKKDENGTNVNLFASKVVDGKTQKEEHHLTAFITQLNGIDFLNISGDIPEEEGEYLFATFQLSNDSLIIHYVQDQPFKISPSGSAIKYSNSTEFTTKFIEMMDNPDFYDASPLIFRKTN